MRFILLTISVLSIGTFCNAQVTSTTLTTTKCAHINTALDINYNNTTFDVLTDHRRGITNYRRGYIEFDLSSIPSDAIIVSATLTITHVGGTYTANPWVTKLVQSSWGETTVKASNQPTISTSTSDWETSYTNSGNDVNIDVKSTVERMVYGAITNYGWCIQVQNEAVAYDSGTSFHSDEASSNEPELKIVYYKPITFSDVVITHESATSAADGSISFSHTDLDTEGHTYTWYNSSGTQLQTGSTSTIEELSYGWYGLKIEGDENNETFYYGFLVGTECEEVTIDFASASGNHYEELFDNSLNTDFDNGGVDWGDQSSPNNLNFQTSRDFVSVAFSTNTYGKVKLWMDDEFIVNQADLYLRGKDHTGTADASRFDIVTSSWQESLITWNNQPSTATSTTVLVPETTSSTEDEVVDISGFWDVWKADNSANYGMLFQLQSFANYTNRQNYYAPPDATHTNRPKISFKLELDAGYKCGDYSFYLKDEVEQSIAYVPTNTVKFKFLEDYHDVTGNLSYTLTLLEDDSEQTGTISKNHLTNWFELTNGVGGVTLTSGKVYLLEVKNTKGQKAYLKFKMS